MKLSNLTVRIISAAVLLPPIILLILKGTDLPFTLFVALLAALAGFEFGGMVPIKFSMVQRALLCALSTMYCLAVSFFYTFPELILITVGLTVPLVSVFFMFSKTQFSESLPQFSYATTGAIYSGALFGFISLLFAANDSGRYWVLLLIGCVIATDTLAYAFGRLFGKRKFSPRISPNKTWAGFFGGVLGSGIIVSVAYFLGLPGIGPVDIMIIAVPLAGISQLGDLTESFLKRGFKIKDSGKIIPGHGGILDRCDALIYSAPFLFFAAKYLYL